MKKTKALHALWIIGLVLFVAVGVLPSIIFAGSPYYALHSDYLVHTYPPYDLLREGLKKGHITCWNPYTWCGMSLWGSPTLLLSLPMAFIFLISSKINIHYLISLHYFFETCLAAIGFFMFSGKWLKGKFFRFGAAILYISSTAYLDGGGWLPIWSFQFCSMPWVLFLIDKLISVYSKKSKGTLFKQPSALPTISILSLVLYLQMTSTIIQFNLYAAAIYYFYTLFSLGPLKERVKRLSLLSLSFIFAFLLAAYYLLPLADNLINFNDMARTGLTLKKMSYSLVPYEYLIRLILPELVVYGGTAWWPRLEPFESFTAYTGAISAVTILYGLFFLGKKLKFWRFLYLFLIFAPINHTIGLPILYLLNLGSGMPYGRITLFMVLPGALINFYVLQKLRQDKKFLIGYILFTILILLLLALFIWEPVTKSFVSNLFKKAHQTRAYTEQFFNQHYPQMLKESVSSYRRRNLGGGGRKDAEILGFPQERVRGPGRPGEGAHIGPGCIQSTLLPGRRRQRQRPGGDQRSEFRQVGQRV